MLLGGTLLLAAIAFGGDVLYTATTQLNADEQVGAEQIQPAVTDSVRLLAAFLDQETALRGYLLAGQREFLQPVMNGERQIPGMEAQLAVKLNALSGATPALNTIMNDFERWQANYENPEIGLVLMGHLPAAQQVAESADGQDLFNAVRNAFVPLEGRIVQAETDNRNQVRSIQHELIVLLIVTLLALGLLVMGSTWLIVRRITIPIGKVADEAAALAGSQDRHPSRRDRPLGEVSRLREYTDTIRSQLTAQRVRSRRATEALAQQGPSVTALVEALEPRNDWVPGLSTTARLDPAEGLLAGDWYDFLAINHETLAVVVGDVSGHGPASAVLALRLRELLIAYLSEGAAPGEALRRAAKANEHGAPELFATVFCAVIHPNASTLSYANAGHPPALLHGPRSIGRSVRPLGPTGPLLSPVVNQPMWVTETQNFPPGAGLLVMTDGAIDNPTPGQQYGTDRLASDVKQLAGVYTESLLDQLVTRLDNVDGRFRKDDRTLAYCLHLA